MQCLRRHLVLAPPQPLFISVPRHTRRGFPPSLFPSSCHCEGPSALWVASWAVALTSRAGSYREGWGLWQLDATTCHHAAAAFVSWECGPGLPDWQKNLDFPIFKGWHLIQTFKNTTYTKRERERRRGRQRDTHREVETDKESKEKTRHRTKNFSKTCLLPSLHLLTYAAESPWLHSSPVLGVGVGEAPKEVRGLSQDEGVGWGRAPPRMSVFFPPHSHQPPPQAPACVARAHFSGQLLESKERE